MVGIGAQVVCVEEEAKSVVLRVRAEYDLILLVDVVVIMDSDDIEDVDVLLVAGTPLELVELKDKGVFNDDELVVNVAVDDTDVTDAEMIVVVVAGIDTVLLPLSEPDIEVDGFAGLLNDDPDIELGFGLVAPFRVDVEGRLDGSTRLELEDGDDAKPGFVVEEGVEVTLLRPLSVDADDI